MTSITRNPVTRNTPWEKYGTEIHGMSMEQAIKTAGIDFQVDKLPLQASVALPTSNNPSLRLQRLVDVPKKSLTVRTDTGEVLGIVGDTYGVIQTHDILNVMEALCGDGWEPEWAGSRRGGAETFMFGKLPYKMRNYPDVTPYMGFFNSYDGSSSLRVASTSIVPSCTNAFAATFGRKRKSGAGKFSFRHTSNVWNRIEDARTALGLQIAWAQNMDDEIGYLLDQPFDYQSGKAFVETLIPLQQVKVNGETAYVDDQGKTLGDRGVTIRMNKRRDILSNWNTSETILDSKRWSKWGVIQAISEIEQHGNRGSATNQDTRLMNHMSEGRVGGITEKGWAALLTV